MCNMRGCDGMGEGKWSNRLYGCVCILENGAVARFFSECRKECLETMAGEKKKRQKEETKSE